TVRRSIAARPAGVSQFGYAVGDKATHERGSTGYRGEKLHSPERNFQPVEFGNKLATNVGRGGTGTGRTLHGQSGSQGTHGGTNPGNPPVQGKDILSSFGPDYRKP